MKMPLDFAALQQIDNGKLGRAVTSELGKIARDVADRFEDSRARKLSVSITFTPAAEDGMVVGATMEMEISSTLPSKRSRPYTLGVHHGGGFVVNPEAPENPQQMTIDEAGAAKSK